MEISIKKLHVIVFLTGAIVMILELVGSRILAPTLGTSLYVWTSLIGIILGSMSLGYYLGGRLSDKDPNLQTYSNLILASGIFIFLVIILKKNTLEVGSMFGPRIGAVLSSMTLFAVPSVLLGAVSPYSVRLALKNVETSGNTVGNLYAISTFGSIMGTFAAGFYLIPNFGSTNILYALAISLFFVSIFAYEKKERAKKTFFILFATLSASIIVQAAEMKNYLVDEDSEYNHIRVYDAADKENRNVRIMAVENFFDSGMYLDSSDLVFEYTKYFRLSYVFKKDIDNVAVFGGAAYSFPKDILQKKEYAKVDVVEIDKKTTEIAERYFNLDTKNERLKIYHEDARTFLNENSSREKEKYDVIINDAFHSTCTTPFQLTTIEAMKEISGLLKKDGFYVMNLISPLSGEKSEFLRSEYKTLKTEFRNVYIFATENNTEEYIVENQNLILIAGNTDVDVEKLKSENSENEYGRMLSHIWNGKIETENAILLTDDYAPVEHFTEKLCEFTNRN